MGRSNELWTYQRKAVLYYHRETRTARVVDVDTLEEETVASDLDQIGPVDADEEYFLIMETPGPNSGDGRYTRPYTFNRYSMSDGSKSVIYEGIGMAGHLQLSPTDPDLLLPEHQADAVANPQRFD